LNVHRSNCLEGSGIYTAEPDIPEPGLLEVKLALENLSKHNAPGVDHILSG
jgi:hypothetical protein